MIALSFLFAMSMALANEPVATKTDILDEMTRRLLDGQMAPGNIETRLMALPPAERFEVIMFLRRSGLLTGKSLSVDRLLTMGSDTEVRH